MATNIPKMTMAAMLTLRSQQQQYSGMPDPGGTANGTGKLDFGGAISFGFKAVFQQPGFWIGMTLLMGVALLLLLE